MKMQTVKIIDAIKEILRAYGYMMYVWHVEDVHFICEQTGLEKLSDEEAMEVFDMVADQFDGEVGMSWPQLEKAVKTYLRRKDTKKLCESEA